MPGEPSDRGCTDPTTARIFGIFAGVARQELIAADAQVLRTFVRPELTDLQCEVLGLVDIVASVYGPARSAPLKAPREPRKAGRVWSLLTEYGASAVAQLQSLARPPGVFSPCTLP